MAVRLLLAALLISLASQTPAPTGTPAPQAPGNASPGNTSPAGPLTPDPAAATFSTDLGLLLVAIKPDKVGDYEEVIHALQDALSRAEDGETRALALGWRVYRVTEADAKANAIYVHVLQPVVPGTDYRPSLWLDKLLSGAPPELLAKYRDSFAAPPTKLPLVELANMAVAPIPKPTNTSPDAPGAPAVPGNMSPPAPGNTSAPNPGNTSPPKPGHISPAPSAGKTRLF